MRVCANVFVHFYLFDINFQPLKSLIDESTGIAQHLSTILKDLASSAIADMHELNQTAGELTAKMISVSKSSIVYPVEWWKDAIVHGLHVLVGNSKPLYSGSGSVFSVLPKVDLNDATTFRRINGLASVLHTLWSIFSVIWTYLGVRIFLSLGILLLTSCFIQERPLDRCINQSMDSPKISRV